MVVEQKEITVARGPDIDLDHRDAGLNRLGNCGSAVLGCPKAIGPMSHDEGLVALGIPDALRDLAGGRPGIGADSRDQESAGDSVLRPPKPTRWVFRGWLHPGAGGTRSLHGQDESEAYQNR